MNYSIVFSSQTGNTELVARRIRKTLGEEGCTYFGTPADAPAGATHADVVFVGSWTDKGTASADVLAFLGTLDHARVFLFGTCGYGESEEYFNAILSRIREELADSCEVAGSFMCQGKMGEAVLGRGRGGQPGGQARRHAHQELRGGPFPPQHRRPASSRRCPSRRRPRIAPTHSAFPARIFA